MASCKFALFNWVLILLYLFCFCDLLRSEDAPATTSFSHFLQLQKGDLILDLDYAFQLAECSLGPALLRAQHRLLSSDAPLFLACQGFRWPLRQFYDLAFFPLSIRFIKMGFLFHILLATFEWFIGEEEMTKFCCCYQIGSPFQ